MNSSSPPPPPPPLHDPSTSVDLAADHQPSLSLSPSLLIVAAILVAVVVASAFIHLLLRFLSIRSRSSSSSVAALPLPLVHPNSRSSSSGAPAAAAEAAAGSILSDQEKAALIDSLPVFSLATALAALPKSSPDCAVCLSAFLPHDKLRLLPACCHAFHSSCVDVWIRRTPSCPLCRTSIVPPTVPLLSPQPASDRPDTSRSDSFRIELGSVSRRRTPSWEEPGNPPHLRSYSIGSSFEYLVEDEIEAVVERVARRTEKMEKRGESNSSAPGPPGEGVAEVAGGEGSGGGLGWLREYVDRLASSASSSFSSIRFSDRWSHRHDGDVDGGGGRNSWDLEATARQEAEEGGYYGFYKWLMGEQSAVDLSPAAKPSCLRTK